MAHALTPEQLERTLQGISVPAQPQILVDLQMELYLPDPDLATIGPLIAQDPGLAGAVLKVANTLTAGERLTCIRQGVDTLGAPLVTALIDAQSIKGEMSDETIVVLNRFWDNAQDVATTSAALARELGVPDEEEAYTLGLLHDCGVPLMLSRFPRYMAELEVAYATSMDGRVIDAENRAYNTNHAVVGYYTARAWRLPHILCAAIGNHHNALAVLEADRNQHTPLKNLLAVLKMAEHVCRSHQVMGAQAEDHEWNRVGGLVLDYVGWSEYDFDNLRQTLREMIAR